MWQRYIQISLYLNNKYKANVALLYSEQMHCHIRTYHKPHKRTELLTTIQVLKVTTANCNINAIFFRNFPLKMQK